MHAACKLSLVRRKRTTTSISFLEPQSRLGVLASCPALIHRRTEFPFFFLSLCHHRFLREVWEGCRVPVSSSGRSSSRFLCYSFQTVRHSFLAWAHRDRRSFTHIFLFTPNDVDTTKCKQKKSKERLGKRNKSMNWRSVSLYLSVRWHQQEKLFLACGDVYNWTVERVNEIITDSGRREPVKCQSSQEEKKKKIFCCYSLLSLFLCLFFCLILATATTIKSRLSPSTSTFRHSTVATNNRSAIWLALFLSWKNEPHFLSHSDSINISISWSEDC